MRFVYVKKGCIMGKAKRILVSAFLLVSCIVMKRLLSIRLPFISIGFDFIPFMFSAILLGTKYATVIGITSDIIGRLLFPMSAYFPGFTIGAGLTGFLYGKFLYRDGKIKADKQFLIRLILCVVVVTIAINIVFNTMCVIKVVGDASKVIVPLRFVKAILMIPIQVIVMYYFAGEVEKGRLFSIKVEDKKILASANEVSLRTQKYKVGNKKILASTNRI